MAFFDCTVGGSGKGNTVVVTCASEFAGQTITLAKTGKTYTKTCPSSSPYTVTFYGVENGTYTVSATVSGDTYSETVIVQDISAVLNYGFNWEAWVDASVDLDSTDYSTLADVLADEEAVRELFLVHDCVDYMASMTASNADLETVINNDYCAKWINLSDYALDTLYANQAIATVMDTADKYGYGEWVITDDSTTPPTWGPKGNVPIMTSNTAPYGTAFGSSVISGSSYSAAFDRAIVDANANKWVCNAKPASIGYQSTNPICVKRFMITPSTTDKPTEFKLQGSNTGGSSDWHDIQSYTNQSLDNLTPSYFDVDNNSDYYLYHRVYISTTNEPSRNYVQIVELQFYGRELSVSVPTMTGSTTPYGEASASSYYDNRNDWAAWCAFSPSHNQWGAANIVYVNEESPEAWIQYEFPSKMVIRAIMAKHGYSEISSYTISGSDDGVNFTPIKSGTDNIINTLCFINNSTEYKVIRLTLKQINRTSSEGAFPQLTTLQFYGLDYSEKEFEVGTTKKWLYDHGVELETLDNPITQNAGYAEKKSDELLVGLTNNSSASSVGLFVNSAIDLTPYELLRATLGDIVYTGDSYQGALGIKHTKSYTITPSDMTLMSSLDLHPNGSPYGKAIDVSSYNSTEYVVLCQAKASGSSVERRFTVTELWLE